MNTRSADARVLAGRRDGLVGTPRQTWIDLARAVALVLVVVGHTERGLVAAGIMPGATADDFDRVIYSFHIPLFFLISGLLFAQSIGRRPFMLSWKARTLRLVQPCLVWSIVLLGLIVLAANLANTPVSPGDALAGILLLPLQPVSIFWFLYTLLLCMLASGLAVEYWRFTPDKMLFWSFVIHLIYLLWLSDHQTGAGLQFVRFGEHQLYFATGFFLAPSVLSNDASLPVRWRPPTKFVGAFAILMTVCFLAAVIVLTELDLSYHSAVGTLAALSASAAVLSACYLVTEIQNWTVPTAVLTISSETLAIFCMHVPFIGAARLAMVHLGVTDATVLLAAGTVAGLSGPLLALRLMDSLGLAGFAGFGDDSRGQRYGGRS
ncbi:acyltransferase family protein [Rhizobium herbae]|uniref:Fucose 4-O-acetylase-like acetyltransferase n=1 Tax=Rhizobium herbae TaxID=508661 RepID=A0ABS4EVS7_9HYPH|nr:acyltransferase [Rhizobium herbae]MBP1862023.1 fucose 4-O-acetylase-like acetyltransferase [Rhizobium herbae]